MDIYTLETLRKFSAIEVDNLNIAGRISDELFIEYEWVWFKSAGRLSYPSYQVREHKPSFAARLLLETILQEQDHKAAVIRAYNERWEIRNGKYHG